MLYKIWVSKFKSSSIENFNVYALNLYVQHNQYNQQHCNLLPPVSRYYIYPTIILYVCTC